MLELLLTNLANLVKVKTIVTLLLVIAIVIGFLKLYVSVEVFIPLVTMVLTFYFTRKEE